MGLNLIEQKKDFLRLNKFLSRWAGLSRRNADELIKKGQVFINNQKVSQLGLFVNPKKDIVRIKKRIVKPEKISAVYIMFNKPRKVLTTSKDPEGRPTVMDYIKQDKKRRLFPVGRLDWDSEGLLLLTNDGDFTDRVLHPKNKIAKTYLVKVKGCPKDSQIRKLVQGVSTPIGRKRALFAKKISKKALSNQWVKIIIQEGKKRQIRLMFDKIGFPVLRLRRTAIGRLKMNKLASGFFQKMAEADRQKVFQKPKELSF